MFTDVPHQNVCKGEDFVIGEHPCFGERDFSQDQEEAASPQTEVEELECLRMKEELGEAEPPQTEDQLCTSPGKEQLVLKTDTETSLLLQYASTGEDKLEVIPEDINQCKGDIAHQTSLLDINSGSKLKLHTTALSQLHACKEEEVDHHICNEERNFSLDLQETKRSELELETDTFVEIPSSDESHQGEPSGPRSMIDQLLSGDECSYQGQSQLEHSGSARNVQNLSLSDGTPTCVAVHEGVKPYSYDSCGKSLSKMALVSYHESMYTVENPYYCNVCGKNFSRRHNLTRHMRTHTGEKPYNCEICGEGFSNSWSLTVHTRTHTGEKPYTCEVCGKGFNQSSSLSDHRRTHTGEKPYSCKLCGKCFGFSSNLLCHMRTHTGEKPYCCKTCGKSFSQSNSLVCHMRTHTGEKPYSCKVCGRCFTLNSQLYSHMRIHK
ncbi:zinc finger protein 391-like isoform X2 [Cololabis saira]|uniref:zinc finger protein 391-like isoform X2 n=1 Tax=Cololabis saira TaxID=129043 RepID=UPI002AD34082|nr:zinc finger protein 391-like isoform X2 [Cololabis saira]